MAYTLVVNGQTHTVDMPAQMPLLWVLRDVLKLKGTKFQITWTTDEPSTSVVAFTGYGSYSNTALVTSHSMSFTGSNGVLYEYRVTSTDASGNSRTEGPFYHQN